VIQIADCAAALELWVGLSERKLQWAFTAETGVARGQSIYFSLFHSRHAAGDICRGACCSKTGVGISLICEVSVDVSIA
jgi:hypothetical protein